MNEDWKQSLIEIQIKKAIKVFSSFSNQPENNKSSYDKYHTLLEHFPLLLHPLSLEKDDVFNKNIRTYLSKSRGILCRRHKKWLIHNNFYSRQIFSHDYKLPSYKDWVKKFKKRANMTNIISIKKVQPCLNDLKNNKFIVEYKQETLVLPDHTVLDDIISNILESLGMTGIFGRKFWIRFLKKYRMFVEYEEVRVVYSFDI